MRLDVLEALCTPRAMRRVTEEPVPDVVQAPILDAAERYESPPSGADMQALVERALASRRVGPYTLQAAIAAVHADAPTAAAVAVLATAVSSLHDPAPSGSAARKEHGSRRPRLSRTAHPMRSAPAARRGRGRP